MNSCNRRNNPLRTARQLPLVMAFMAASAWGQPAGRASHIGYLYPAGGQQGSTVQVMAGGQYLTGADRVCLSGEGVRASIVRYVKPLSREELRGLQLQFNEVQRRRQEAARRGEPPAEWTAEALNLPDHPFLKNLEKMRLSELRTLAERYRRQQFSMQIAELALIEVTVDGDAAPGARELRLGTPLGLTNPLRFEVGTLPEVREEESNNPAVSGASAADLPVLFNGQILPGDCDRFRFKAQKGQHLVIAAHARGLLPYLADAVPGWFQSVLTLYDARGREVAFADDYRVDPDPVLLHEIMEDGEYEVEIRDALYRGREDFVYRISVGEQPFITSLYPLGGRLSASVEAEVTGWNLAPLRRLRLDTSPGPNAIREAALERDGWRSNCLPYVVSELAESEEMEPNDTADEAQQVLLPLIINGRIANPGDVDTFQFEGDAGAEVAVEVQARRLHSPLDSLLRLTAASGRVIDWNDDHEDPASGLLTHHADSCLLARLPEDGVYAVYLSDAQHQGGEAYAYRLRMSAPRPDFTLRATPSSINVRAGFFAPLKVYALRRDGFDGEIEVVLRDAPPGFALSGGRIPKGRDCVRMTVAAPRKPLGEPVELRLEGRATIDGQVMSRPVVPAEDLMQAFIYRHLTPSQQLMAAVLESKRRVPSIKVECDGPAGIPLGGEIDVRVTTGRLPILEMVQMELSEPPKCVTLKKTTVLSDGAVLTLAAAEETAELGYADNLIVEVFTEVAGQQRPGNAARQKRRISLGVLPAIPFEIVPP